MLKKMKMHKLGRNVFAAVFAVGLTALIGSSESMPVYASEENSKVKYSYEVHLNTEQLGSPSKVEGFIGGNSLVRKNDRSYCVINSQGEVILDNLGSYQASQIEPIYYEGKDYLRLDDADYKKGIISNSGKVIVPFEYSEIEEKDNFIIAKKGNYPNYTYGVYGWDGEELLECKYLDVKILNFGTQILAKDANSSWYLFDASGKELCSYGVYYDMKGSQLDSIEIIYAYQTNGNSYLELDLLTGERVGASYSISGLSTAEVVNKGKYALMTDSNGFYVYDYKLNKVAEYLKADLAEDKDYSSPVLYDNGVLAYPYVWDDDNDHGSVTGHVWEPYDRDIYNTDGTLLLSVEDESVYLNIWAINNGENILAEMADGSWQLLDLDLNVIHTYDSSCNYVDERIFSGTVAEGYEGYVAVGNISTTGTEKLYYLDKCLTPDREYDQIEVLGNGYFYAREKSGHSCILDKDGNVAADLEDYSSYIGSIATGNRGFLLVDNEGGDRALVGPNGFVEKGITANAMNYRDDVTGNYRMIYGLGKTYLIDMQTFEVIKTLDQDFVSSGNFNRPGCFYAKDAADQYYLISASGNVGEVSGQLSRYKNYEDEDGNWIALTMSNYYLVSEGGEVLLDIGQWDAVSFDDAGVIAVQKKNSNYEMVTGYIKYDGTVLADPSEYTSIEKYEGKGYVVQDSDGVWHLLNTNGEVACSYTGTYDRVTPIIVPGTTAQTDFLRCEILNENNGSYVHQAVMRYDGTTIVPYKDQKMQISVGEVYDELFIMVYYDSDKKCVMYDGNGTSVLELTGTYGSIRGMGVFNEGYVPASDWDEWVVYRIKLCKEELMPNKPASLTSPGSIGGSYCSDCGHVFEEGIEIPQISEATVKLSATNFVYDGNEKKPTLGKITDASGKELVEGTDYNITYPVSSTAVGKYKVTVSFTGNYEGTKSLEYLVVPKAPAKISAALSGAHNKVKISWNASTGANKYYVYYKKSTASSYTKLGETKSLSYTKSGLSSNTKYDFKVVAVYNDGAKDHCDASKYVTAAIKTQKNVAAPKTVKAVLYGYDDVKITWTKSSSATGYYVYMKKAAAADSTYKKIKTITKATTLYYKKSSLEDGVKYTFKVVPYYKDGSTNVASVYSKTVSITTLKKIAKPTIAKSSNGYVKVTWKNIDGESGYQISQSTTKKGTKIVSTYATTSGKTKKITAKKGKLLYYKVRAYKTVDGKKIYGPWSDVKSYKLK